MTLIISPRDTAAKLNLENVELCCQSHRSLFVVFTDGRCRHYPMEHIWYWEYLIPAGDNRTKPAK